MAATTFVASGVYTSPSGGVATGTVTFTANNLREVNNNTIQDAIPIKATLTNGVLSQTLVINVGGYTVLEDIVGSTQVSVVA